MVTKAYLAGPDVFLPGAGGHARRKIGICARHGLEGLAPLNEDVASLQGMGPEDAWATIYRKDIAMMEACDVIIANLTPFRGASADSGTLIEVGSSGAAGRCSATPTPPRPSPSAASSRSRRGPTPCPA